jgi:hypothetical protein
LIFNELLPFFLIIGYMGAPGPKGDAGDVSEKGQKGEVNLSSFTS